MPSEDAEGRIRELESEVRRLQMLLESAPDFITLITVDGKFLYLNRVAPGFCMEDVLGTPVDEYIPPESREPARAARRDASEKRTVQQYATLGQIAPDRVGHYLTRVSPVIEEGKVTSLVVVATDVSALEEQRIRLQLALDAGGLGIWTYNSRERKNDWDDTCRRIFGFSQGAPAPSPEETLRDFVHPDDRARVVEAIQRAPAAGRFGPLEYRVIRPKSGVRWVAASGLALRDYKGEIVTMVGTVQDVTERRALEARLLEAQKLESIGRLAGGVAHDFNNMLTAILGNVEFAQEARSIEEVQPLLASIRVCAERSAALTAQLLAFARQQMIAPKVFGPNALVERLLGVFQRTLGEHIRVTVSLTARGQVCADESQLEQVVMNLVTNARDAMDRGGTLSIETDDLEIDHESASAPPDMTPGRYVMIAVRDTGPGIAPEVLPHLFEPFFTTRSRGTGLGLATCYGIVKQAGGHIAVHSAPERGTTFQVYLPRVEDAVSHADVRVPTARVASGERVLLVEDEISVRVVVERTLTSHGYRVVSTATAEEALSAVEQEAPFDVLITDLGLPGMDGRALAQRLSAGAAGPCVLFISGYTEDARARGEVLDRDTHYLQKPFLPAELLVAVSKALEGRGHSR